MDVESDRPPMTVQELLEAWATQSIRVANEWSGDIRRSTARILEEARRTADALGLDYAPIDEAHAWRIEE